MNPYIGLRFFDEQTAHLFFGRDEYIADLVEKIEETRFLAVLGHSGSGKSSLVRAGLIPALRAEGGDWVVAKFRPETKPIRSLATELDACLKITETEADLRRGPLGIVEAFERSTPPKGTRLLLVADQFEEIFRLEEESAEQPGAREEAAAFVRLLLQANRHPDIYVVLTMRSDYLKDCARYRDLPERINRGIYLVPRMKRDELEMAIVGPARGTGVALDPPLVQRLLNDAAGPDLDHLPLIQHLLSRIWEEGADSGRLTVAHYGDAGGWGTCLSKHADDVFGKLNAAEQQVCELVFRRLTLRDEANRDVRSRASFQDLVDWCAGRRSEVGQVVGLFHSPKNALLTYSGAGSDTVVDITHESLIRNWTKLTGNNDCDGWIHRETEARETFRGLYRRARREGQKGKLEGSELREAEDLVIKTYSKAWVKRYLFPEDALEKVAHFVRESRKAARLSFAIKWTILSVIIGGLSYVGWPVVWPVVHKQVRDYQRTHAGRQNPIDGLRYIYVPPGEFEMGCSPGDSECLGSEMHRHRVTLSKGFWIGQTEVTQSAYERVLKKGNPSYFKGQDRPVENVSWNDAKDYCEAAGKMRLPTEAEWEYAARAGSNDARYGKIEEIAWYSENSVTGTEPVATKLPNQWELYDMLGNVWEWNADWYQDGYYKQSPRVDPRGPEGALRYKAARGGARSYGSREARVSNRFWFEPAYRTDSIGFRCAGELP